MNIESIFFVVYGKLSLVDCVLTVNICEFWNVLKLYLSK
jgi:hypothetical protein